MLIFIFFFSPSRKVSGCALLLFGAPALFSAEHRSSLGLCSPRGCICSALPR